MCKTYRREGEDAEGVVAGYESDGGDTQLTDDGVAGRHAQSDGVTAVGPRQSVIPHGERRAPRLLGEPGAEPHRPRRTDKVRLDVARRAAAAPDQLDTPMLSVHGGCPIDDTMIRYMTR